jgi:hemolysin III
MDVLSPREPLSTWSHGLWLVMAVPGTLWLWKRSGGDRARQISLLIYGLSLGYCAAASTLYHGARLAEEWIATFARLDHVGIYLLIAGSYTGMAWTLLSGRFRTNILALVWLWAAAGSVLHLAGIALPPWLSTGLYLAMGWGSLVCYYELTRRLAPSALLPIPLGGVLYSLGAGINLLGQPILWPGVFEAHEMFHLFVVAGSAVHFRFVLGVVAPFEREAEIPALDPSPLVVSSPIAASCAPNRVGG